MSAVAQPGEGIWAGEGSARAIALTADVQLEGVPQRLLAAADFVLVSTEEQYAHAVEAGAQPILVTRSFSVTDTRGRSRLLLGALIGPWRWRRVLLNEGIGSLAIITGGRADASGRAPGKGGLDFRIAAVLAGTRVVRPLAVGGDEG